MLNAAWGWNGPPLAVNTASLSAKSVVLQDGDAAGAASIKNSEVDYYRFTPAQAGFYQVSVSAKFDAMIGVYASGSSGNLLGYADAKASGTERATVYLTGGATYFLAITNFSTTKGGSYGWAIKDIPSPAAALTDASKTLYLSFDGAFLAANDLRTWDNDWTYGTAAEFDPRRDGVSVQPFLKKRADREVIINSIMNHVRADLSAFDIKVVRLAADATAVAGVGATTIFVGPATLEDLSVSARRRSLFHVAGDIDEGNDNLTDIAFVADEDWGSAANTALALADVILHEAGHTYGLSHVESGNAAETMGLRYSVKQSGWLRDTGFMNQSFRYDGYYGSQNSFQAVAAAFGAGGGGSNRDAKSRRAEYRAQERLLYLGPVVQYERDEWAPAKQAVGRFAKQRDV